MSKIQRNKKGINVLVETQTSKPHNSAQNKDASIIRVLTDEDVEGYWPIVPPSERKALVKKWLKGREGFATSNVNDPCMGIKVGTIVAFEYVNK